MPRPTTSVPTSSTRRRSIRDVAEVAGVSVGTVSNVLNGRTVVAEPTRQRVQDAIARLGFVRNESARQLRAGRSRTIGIVVMDIANPFFTDVTQGAEEIAQADGGTIIICNSHHDPMHEQRLLAMLEEQRVLGLLLSPLADGGPQLQAMVDRGTPVILVDRGTGTHGLCSVSVDDVLGGRLAMEHLVSLGHRSIVFVGGPLGIEQVQQRLAGAQEVADAASRPAVRLRVEETTALSVDEGRRAMARLLSARRRPPSAVFCANDLLALGVLQESTRRGLAVPQDLAIVGYDDIDFASAAAVPLTSVRQPRAELGRSAARLLLAEVADGPEHRHQQVLFSPDLVVRESTVAAAPGMSAATVDGTAVLSCAVAPTS